jgi:hypothetical protein
MATVCVSSTSRAWDRSRMRNSWHGALPRGRASHPGAVAARRRDRQDADGGRVETDGILAKRLAAEGDELKVGDLIDSLPSRLRPLGDRGHRPASTRQDHPCLRSGGLHGRLTQPIRGREARGVGSQKAGSDGDPVGGLKLSPLARRLAKEHGINRLGTRDGPRRTHHRR